jgi:hypothetical protein
MRPIDKRSCSGVGLVFARRYSILETNTDNRAGRTVGAGVEWALAAQWTAKLEYLCVDLGTFYNSFLGRGAFLPGQKTRGPEPKDWNRYGYENKVRLRLLLSGGGRQFGMGTRQHQRCYRRQAAHA